MKCYSYVVARDYGFAPNPFGSFCTLATCKPDIRAKALIGDIVVGTGSCKYKSQKNLIFVMRIDEKLTFDEYWEDNRFRYKKPVLNGSLKQMYGDNIYHFNPQNNSWEQLNSHHSLPDGSPNPHNMKKDLKSNFVLVSKQFWYFGKNSIFLPEKFQKMCKIGQGHKSNFDLEFIEEFYAWISTSFRAGYNGDPCLFTRFDRYDGIS